MSMNALRFIALPLSATAVTVLAMTALTSQVDAEDEAKAPSLGPASSVILEGADAATVTLGVEDERVSWGDAVQQRVYSTGYIFVGRPLTELLGAEVYLEEHQELEAEVNAALEAIGAQVESLQGRMDGVDPDSEDAAQIQMEGQQLMQQRQQIIEQATGAQAMLRAKHLEEAYAELVEAVNVVADRNGIDIVQRFLPPEDEFGTPQGPGAFNYALNQVRMRSLLRYPEDCDITDEVMEELGLE